MMQKRSIGIGWSLILLLNPACGQSPTETIESSEREPTVNYGQLNISIAETEAIVPQDLVLSSPTEQQSLEAIEALSDETQASLTQSSGDNDFLSQLNVLKSTITTKDLSSCTAAMPSSFSLAQDDFGHATCFGPTITGNDVDIPSGNAGIWWDYADVTKTSGEACSSEAANSLMESVGAYAQTAIGLISFVGCAGRLDSLALPDTVGESVDFTDTISSVDTSSSNFSLSSVLITYERDNSESFPVFVTDIEGSLTDISRDLTKSFSLRFKHVVQSNTFQSYSGVAQFQIQDFEDSRDLAMSLKYKYANSNLQYRYRQAFVTTDSTEYFDSTSNEVAENYYTADSSWAEVLDNVDKSGFGSLAIVWRTSTLLVFNAQTQSDGTGSAYFGHRDDSTSFGSDDFYTIQGMACLPVSPGIQYTSLVQKQSLSLDLSSGYWNLDDAETLFAPTATCDSGTGDNYIGRNDGYAKSVNGPITNELESIADYQSDWVAPSIPEVVLD
ncbi:hypothetical protein [Pseudobacteriovorax antillogorgiicola]|uniref:Uncharacterized protein n=1 Tax=Pseudobacteriovorax antillogorgiicola TaxID=1513793 RepID=A0A1Y6BRY1_9BACT|nr:hypothetical protein [Pseudobacteriovorax antillogorgiicola]TCS53784.1 hypothetical protein EDD56_10793 [Pseudobacteriovorax antillogorgiicola]SMF22284.1 hypothetical protein SAMN06296036_107179 [Pseudobacteriovorax antillogorgiicola]